MTSNDDRHDTPPPAVPLVLAPEEREALEHVLGKLRPNDTAMNAPDHRECKAAARVIRALLAASPSQPVAPAEQLRTLLIQKRADLAWAYQSVTAARASRYHGGADVTRDDEVRETLATLESIATAPPATPPAGEPMTVAMALMLPEVRSGEKWVEYVIRYAGSDMHERLRVVNHENYRDVEVSQRPRERWNPWGAASISLEMLDCRATLVDPEPAKEGA